MLGFREEVDKILNDNKKECIEAIKIAIKVLDSNKEKERTNES